MKTLVFVSFLNGKNEMILMYCSVSHYTVLVSITVSRPINPIMAMNKELRELF